MKPNSSEGAASQTPVKCPECGAPTWCQLADGFQTLFCYSATCHWKQRINKDHDAAIRQDEREKVLDEIRDKMRLMVKNGTTVRVHFRRSELLEWIESLRRKSP
jgi:hypothetical protein